MTCGGINLLRFEQIETTKRFLRERLPDRSEPLGLRDLEADLLPDFERPVNQMPSVII